MNADPKERGIRGFAFITLCDFVTKLEAAARAVNGGWLYEETSRALIASASAALPFLDERIRADLEEVIRMAEGLRLAHEKGLVSEWAERATVDGIATLIVEATLGAPDKKLKEEPAPAPKPATAAANEIPF